MNKKKSIKFGDDNIDKDYYKEQLVFNLNGDMKSTVYYKNVKDKADNKQLFFVMIYSIC